MKGACFLGDEAFAETEAEDETRGGGIMLTKAGARVLFVALGGVTRAPEGVVSAVAGTCIRKVGVAAAATAAAAAAARSGRDLSLIAVLAMQEPAQDA